MNIIELLIEIGHISKNDETACIEIKIFNSFLI